MSMRGFQQRVGALLLALALLPPRFAEAQAMRPERVISLNMCTDQLLLDLAPPGQIIGLSPFARDAARSWAAARVGTIPVLSGTAEEIMVMKPDLVVSSRFTKRETRAFIRARGIPLEEFGLVKTLADAKAQIHRFGEITGNARRASERIAELDAATDLLRAAASASPVRVLPLSRRGWVSGEDSLITDLLKQGGLGNAASELGLQAGGIVTLEAIVMLRPDAILISRDSLKAEDQGSAMLLHPSIQHLFPPERRLVLPERLTVCGGPMLSDAVRLLATQISRLKPRVALN